MQAIAAKTLSHVNFRRLGLLLLLPLTMIPFQNCGRVFDKQDPKVVYASPTLGRQTTTGTSNTSSNIDMDGTDTGSIGDNVNTGTGDGSTGTGNTGTGSIGDPGSSNIPGATATPVPTPPPTPVPSTRMSTTLPNFKVLPRSCDMLQVAVVLYRSTDIGNGINYQFCMILGRWSNNIEGYNWYHGIKDGDIDPDVLAPTLFGSPEFAQRYGTPTMSNQDFAIFIIRLLVYREPTLEEVGGMLQAVGQTASAQAQQAMIQMVTSSPAFMQANPYLVQLRQAYQ